MTKIYFNLLIFSVLTLGLQAQIPIGGNSSQRLQNEPIDVSGDFRDFTNTYYLADSLKTFNPETGSGTVVYRRYEYSTRMAFNNLLAILKPVGPNEFPTNEYQASPELPFSIEFISPRTVRIRTKTSNTFRPDEESLMLVNGKAPIDKSWKYSKEGNKHVYKSSYGSVVVSVFPWRVQFFDANGNLLTQTTHFSDVAESTYTPVLPFSFVRRASDYSRSVSATFTLSAGEKIYGCGESFTRLDKRGQKVVLWADDGNGVQNETMYKPIPFFMSSKGYAMFMHTTSPITCDFGKYFNSTNSLMIGDDELDLFVFIGKPKDLLQAYTDLTGKAQMPPLWSFGLWMSRITYFSENDGRNIASNLRKNKIPSDVIHFDTGWFETDWQCDYQFSPSRFQDPVKMISDLKQQGFHISLWQLPYFVPRNKFFKEIVDNGLAVRDAKGNLPYEDAVLDFSNPATVTWYQSKIANLLKQGVGAIKVDFGEAAPANGIYASGKTGFYEHNLYPLRYNKAVAEITKQVNNENIIWARSAWAGSQRYPLHWGGDAENTNTGMEAELRGGLSLGLSGFTFWSHDIGGFVLKTPEELYRRWLPFGMLTSHSRCHGAPPKEPWEYGEDFNNYFRKVVEMKYKLMPYVYAQSKLSSDLGLPMLRALFVEFPNDPGAWNVEDEYMFGSDMLVAPLFDDNAKSRNVYLPDGKWVDYQSGKVYEKGWQNIAVGEIEAIILVRDGAVLPKIKLAQSTMQMDWSKLKLEVYSSEPKNLKASVCLPSNNKLNEVELSAVGNNWKITNNPFGKEVEFSISTFNKK